MIHHIDHFFFSKNWLKLRFSIFISGNTSTANYALLQKFPPCFDRPIYRTRINDCHSKSADLPRAIFFRTPVADGLSKHTETGRSLSKFKLKLIDPAKFTRRWSVQKSPLKFEQFFYRHPCAVCKSGNVYHRTPPKVGRNAHSNGKYSKHDSLVDGKADRIERVKM